MVTVDMLHDVDIGEGKRLLTHLVQIIEWLGVEVVHKFDEWYVLHVCVDVGQCQTLMFSQFSDDPSIWQDNNPSF